MKRTVSSWVEHDRRGSLVVKTKYCRVVQFFVPFLRCNVETMDKGINTETDEMIRNIKKMC